MPRSALAATPENMPTPEQVRAELARESLPEFVRLFWPLIVPDQKLDWNWHHDELCELLESITRGDLKLLLINVPPGFSKSLIVSVMWPAWEWTGNPSLRYLTAAYTADNTIRDNLNVRTIVTSDLYRRHYGVKLASDQAAKVRFDTTAKGWRIASSVGGRGTGEHPDRIIVDDPMKAQDARSEAKREECNFWFDRTLSTRINRNPAFVVVMQRLHEEDLSGHLLAQGGYTSLILPMHFDPERSDPRDHRTEPRELLWPEVYPEEKVYENELRLGPFGAAGQLEQNPVPEGGALFKRDWFEIVDAAPADAERCRGWDIAETDGGGNWTVGTRLAQGQDGIWYVEHNVRAQSTLVDKLIRGTAESDGRRCKIREGSGSGKATIKARSILLAGYDYAASPETDSKIERAAPFRAQAQAGNVKLVRGEWNESYLDIVCSFPVGKFDDDVDSTSNAFNELVGANRYTGLKLTW